MRIVSIAKSSIYLLALVLSVPAVGAQVVRADPPAAATPPSVETATQFYLRYQAAIPKAKTIEEVLAFWSSGLTRQFNRAPPAQRVGIDGIKGIYGMITNVTIVKETPTISGATLSLEGLNADKKKITGSVNILKEDDGWKIADQENWQG